MSGVIDLIYSLRAKLSRDNIFSESLCISALSGLPSIATAAVSFGAGFYSGVREEPFKIAKSTAIALGLSVATAGAGSFISGTYGAIKTTKLFSIGSKAMGGLS